MFIRSLYAVAVIYYNKNQVEESTPSLEGTEY